MNAFPLPAPRLLTALAFAFVGLAASPELGWAQASIGVNFGSTGSGTLAPADVAGVPGFAQAGWNNVTATPTNRPLTDANGAATTATLTTVGVTSFGIFTGTVQTNPDDILNNTRANNQLGNTWTFSVANIPYPTYALVVYDLQFAAGAVMAINAAGTTYYTSSPQWNAPGYLDNNSATPYTYTQGTSTDSLNPTPLSNYVVFSNLTDSSLTVTLTGGNNAVRVSGFQIVPVIPEASTCAMLLVGGVGLLAAGRRKGKRQTTDFLPRMDANGR